MITVSVLMITYGHEKYIEEAINGVLIQKCDFEVELIIADDNSPDNTEDIVANFLKDHPKKEWVRYTKHKANKGMIANGKWAFRQSKGKYIALCEGDDYWIDPFKLQKQVDILESNLEYGLVFTDFDIFYDKEKLFRRNVFKQKAMPVYYSFQEHLVKAGYLAPCTWICRRELVPVINPHLVDGTFAWMLHVLAHSKIKYLADTTSVYRFLPESASRSASLEKRFIFSNGVFQIQKDFLNKYRQPNEIKLRIFKSTYLELFPIASMLDKDSFIQEAREFWKEHKTSLKEQLFYQLSQYNFSSKLFKILYRIKNKIRQNLGIVIASKTNVWILPRQHKNIVN